MSTERLEKARQVAEQLKCEGRFDGIAAQTTDKTSLTLKNLIDILNTAWREAKAQDHIEVVDEKTKEQLLQELQDSEYIFNTENFQSFPQLFSEQVKAYPDHIALIYDSWQCSYAELDARVNRLAQQLRVIKKTKNLSDGACVGLFFENIPEAIISIIAVMKANLAYVPLAVNETVPETLDSHIRCSQLQFLICQTSLLNHSAVFYIKDKHLDLDIRSFDEVDKEDVSEEKFEQAIKGQQLAYIMFSSGSSGLPKGVCVSHRGLCFPVQAVKEAFSIEAKKDRVAWYAELTFDASLLDIMTALGTGATCVIIPQSIRKKGEELQRYLKEKAVTIVTFVPSILRELKLNPQELPDLRGIIFTGEAMNNKALFHDWLTEGRLAEHPRDIFNGYGVTEATICNSLGRYKKEEAIHIGEQAIKGVEWYVLELGDAENPFPRNPSKVSKGEGELYLAGDGVALGYLNKEDPQQRFRTIFDPNGSDRLVRIYQTGDLVCWNGNTMEVKGRLDVQYKYYGKAINLSGLEATLQDYEENGAAVFSNVKVTVQSNDDHPFLHAYLRLLPEAINNFTEKSLREIYFYLRHHQINLAPSRYHIVNEWPTNDHGKLAVQGLSQAIEKTFSSHCAFQLEPKKEIEQQMAKLWREIFGFAHEENVYLDDNFYELGGNSILTNLLFGKIKHIYPYFVEDFDLFNTCPTIRNLAFQLEFSQKHSEAKKTLAESIQWAFVDHAIGTSTPVILVHSITGNARNDYKNIVEKWQEIMGNWPLLVIHAPSLNNPGYVRNSLVQLASDYCKVVQEKLKEYKGPIILLGYSAGGILAYEMTKQFQENGQLVAVGCIDTLSCHYYRTLSQAEHAKEIYQLMQYSVSHVMGLELNDHGMTLKELQHYAKDAQLLNYWRKLKEKLAQKGPEDKEKYLGLYITLCNMILNQSNYQAVPIQNVQLFAFTDTIKKKSVDQRLGWEVSLPLEVTELDLEHLWICKTEMQNAVVERFMPHLKKFISSHQSLLSKQQKYRELQPQIQELKSLYLNSRNNQLCYNDKIILPIEQGFIDFTLSKQNSTGNDGCTSVNNLLAKTSRQTSIKLLFRGSLGAGKTTLCRYIANQWAKGKLLADYHLVFLACGDFSTGKISDNLKNIIEELKKKDAKNTLFLLDNFDLLDQASESGRYINDLVMHGEFSYIITLKQVNSSDFFEFDSYTLTGFDDEGVEKYLRNYFKYIHQSDSKAEVDTAVVIQKPNPSEQKKKITEILHVVGEATGDTKILGENLHINRAELEFSISNLDAYYTRDLIDLLLYAYDQEGSIAKVYGAVTVEMLKYYHAAIAAQANDYAFIPLSVSFDNKEPRVKNHWVALIIDRKNCQLFYLDPAKKTMIPQQLVDLKVVLGYEKEFITNPIDFQSKEKQEGWIRHCGAYVVEIFKCFYNAMLRRHVMTDEQAVMISDETSLQTILSDIPCGEAENIIAIRGLHIDMAYELLLGSRYIQPEYDSTIPNNSGLSAKEEESAEQNNVIAITMPDLFPILQKEPLLKEFIINPFYLSLLAQYWVVHCQKNQDDSNNTIKMSEILSFISSEMWRIYEKKLLQTNRDSKETVKLEKLLEGIATQIWLRKSSNITREIIMHVASDRGIGILCQSGLEVSRMIHQLLQGGFLKIVQTDVVRVESLQEFQFFHSNFCEFLTVNYLRKNLTYENREDFSQYLEIINTYPHLYNIIQSDDDNAALKLLLSLRAIKKLSDKDLSIILKCQQESQIFSNNIEESPLYRIIFSRIDQAGVSDINAELQEMFDNNKIVDPCDFQSLLIQIYNYEPDNNILRYKDFPDTYFKNRTILINNPRGVLPDSERILSARKYVNKNKSYLHFELESHAEIGILFENDKFHSAYFAKRILNSLSYYLWRDISEKQVDIIVEKDFYFNKKFISLEIDKDTQHNTLVLAKDRYILDRSVRRGLLTTSTVFYLKKRTAHNNFNTCYEIHLGRNQNSGVLFVNNATGEKTALTSKQFEAFQVFVLDNTLIEGITPENVKDKIKIKPKQENEKNKFEILEKIDTLSNELRQILLDSKNIRFLNLILDDLILNQFTQITEDIFDKVKSKVPNLKEILENIVDLSEEIAVKMPDKKILMEIALSANYANLVRKTKNLDVLRVMKLLEKAFEHIEKMKGKELILVEGNTGSGKSTVVNNLIGVKLKRQDNKYGQPVIVIDERQNLQETVYAKIGQAVAISETIFTQGYGLITTIKSLPNEIKSENIMIADSAGSKDTRGLDYELVTALSRDHVIKNCSIRSVVLVAPYEYFLIDRATLIMDFFNSLSQKLENSFENPRLRGSIYLIITKYDRYPATVRTSFSSFLDDLLRKEREAFNTYLTENKQNLNMIMVANYNKRISLWKFLCEMKRNEQIEFINIDNISQPSQVIRKLISKPCIDKDDFVLSMNQDFMQRHLGIYIQMLIHTWKEQIIKHYLETIPKSMDDINDKIIKVVKNKNHLIERNNSLQRLIDNAENNIRNAYREKDVLVARLTSNHFEDSDTLIIKIKKQSRRLKTEDLEDKKKQREDLHKQFGLSELAQSEYKEKIQCEVEKISMWEKKIRQRKENIEKWSEDSEDILLWQFNPNPDEEMTISRCKDGTIKKAFNEFRLPMTDEIINETKVLARDYEGRLYHCVLISKEYCLVPKDKKEQKEFLESSKSGLFMATLEGDLTINLGKKADETATKVLYSLCSTWVRGGKIPTGKIVHTIPNVVINEAVIENANAESVKFTELLTKANQSLKELQQDLEFELNVYEATNYRINALAHEIEDLEQRAIREDINDMIEDYKVSIENYRKDIKEHETEIGNNEEDIKKCNERITQEEKNLEDKQREKKHYAIIVKTQMNIVELLRKFAQLTVDNKLINKRAAQSNLTSECVEFIAFYDKSVKQLREESEKDLAPVHTRATSQSTSNANTNSFTFFNPVTSSPSSVPVSRDEPVVPNDQVNRSSGMDI